MKAFNMVYSQARQPSRAMGKKVVVLATCMAFAACTAEGPVPTSVQHDPSQNQRYTDGRVEPNVPLGDGCAAYIQKHYAHPPLMAIGDSLYNGVQSMRINWWLSEWSAPTLVAIRTHLIDEKAADRTGKRDFFDPQYPGQGDAPGTPMKDYGFNLEAVTIGNALSAPSTQHAMLAALDSYMPPNNRPVVDNLAFSGAMSDDLIDWTGKDYETNAQALLPILKKADLVGSGFDILASTFFNVNARFVLNPTHNACIDTLSALDQVRLRTPRRLLVNIGANDGLWRIAFLGSSVDMQSCPIPSSNVPNTNTNGKGVPECQGSSIAETAGPVYLRNMQRIITSLAADEGIGWIYINGMPRPSQTANMVPEQDGSWSVDLFHRPGLTADKMAAADKLIVDTNTALSDMIQKANNAAKPGFPHFAYVDLATELDDYDYKRCLINNSRATCQNKQLVVGRRFGLPCDQRLDNQPLKFGGPSGLETGGNMCNRIKQGGLMSFDNMHLSTVGYEIMAKAVLDQIAFHEGLPKIARPDDPHPCKAGGEPGFDKMQDYDCIADMVVPGWAYADASERNFVFDRLGGARQTENQELFGAIAGFAMGITQKSAVPK